MATIKPEIRHMTLVKSGAGSTRTLTLKTSCPPGTEVDLVGDGETVRTHIATGGRLESSEFVVLIAFLERHPITIRVGAGVGLDLGPAADLIAAAHNRQTRERAEVAERQQREEQATVAAVVPPPVPRRTSIRWQPFGPPQVFGVVIDFPLAALCRSDAACLPGQRCADRGDGVPLCFGPGARHPFCAATIDCSAAFCTRRPDGVGLCVR
jgi:hypothetical protein